MNVEVDVRPNALVRRLISGALVPVVWFSVLLGIALTAGWPERSVAVRTWLVGVGLVSLRVLLLLLGRERIAGRADGFDRAVAERPADPPELPPSYVVSGRLLDLVSGTAGDVHFRVRPELREVAAHRLLTRRSLVMDDPAQEAAAAECCGPLLWGIVRPDRPEPADRRIHELDEPAAAELVASLEQI